MVIHDSRWEPHLLLELGDLRAELLSGRTAVLGFLGGGGRLLQLLFKCLNLSLQLSNLYLGPARTEVGSK
jgi:hypothetical protein